VSWRLEDYRFDYPEHLVAVRPAEPRDASRLLVLDRAKTALEHRRFSDLAEYLKPGDCLVLNRSRVLPARVLGVKSTGGKADLLLVRRLSPRRWTALSAHLKPGARVNFDGGLCAVAERLDGSGEWILDFDGDGVEALMDRSGEAPLPPYIQKRRKSEPVETADRERYQTVYAKEPGSIAAPTAGLHFTAALLEELRERGVETAELILHVGPGTFRPVKTGDVREHPMLPERFEVPAETPEKLRRAKRLIPIGTTAVRTLETLAEADRSFRGVPDRGDASLFIYPGRPFRAVDALVTNFHQPDSTPILLASAFVGRERLLEAYREAVRLEYRLFSYGDAMLIL